MGVPVEIKVSENGEDLQKTKDMEKVLRQVKQEKEEAVKVIILFIYCS